MMNCSIWIGWEPREAAAFAVARRSILHHLSRAIPVQALMLGDLQTTGFYTRPIERRTIAGRTVMYDVLSDAAMSTEHANSRFLIPFLAYGWAIFMDSDMLCRADLAPLFAGLDPKYAVYCVKHVHNPPPGMKMDGQIQALYARKNWSSFMAINCEHPAHKTLTLKMINSVPGRDLHRFCWLDEALIGELDPAWNYLVGHSDRSIQPKMVHYTSGMPDMPGYEDCEYADEWRAELRRWLN
jgi:hypothetical protein